MVLKKERKKGDGRAEREREREGMNGLGKNPIDQVESCVLIHLKRIDSPFIKIIDSRQRIDSFA